jgi:hypothetical protein
MDKIPNLDISNDFRLMSCFIGMIYVIVSFNPTIDFVIRLCGKKLLEVTYKKFDTLEVSYKILIHCTKEISTHHCFLCNFMFWNIWTTSHYQITFPPRQRQNCRLHLLLSQVKLRETSSVHFLDKKPSRCPKFVIINFILLLVERPTFQ